MFTNENIPKWHFLPVGRSTQEAKSSLEGYLKTYNNNVMTIS